MQRKHNNITVYSHKVKNYILILYILLSLSQINVFEQLKPVINNLRYSVHKKCILSYIFIHIIALNYGVYLPNNLPIIMKRDRRYHLGI